MDVHENEWVFFFSVFFFFLRVPGFKGKAQRGTVFLRVPGNVLCTLVSRETQRKDHHLVGSGGTACSTSRQPDIFPQPLFCRVAKGSQKGNHLAGGVADFGKHQWLKTVLHPVALQTDDEHLGSPRSERASLL